MQEVKYSASSMRLARGEGVTTFIDKSGKTNDNVGFSDEQNFVFLSKAFEVIDDVRQFVVLPASKTFVTLVGTLHQYNESKTLFGMANSKARSRL